MIVLSIISTIYDNLLASSWIEAIAVFFGLLSVWFAKKENILVYPTGIISVLIYVYICLNVKLYADMGINAFYFIMSIYGWVKWSMKTTGNKARPITKASGKEWLLSIAGLGLFFIILVYVLKNYTDSNVPVWDALTTAIFIIGMWLMALKKIENWIFWIAGDLISIPLYASKDLVLTSFQFTVFLALAIAGYLEWRSKIRLLRISITGPESTGKSDLAKKLAKHYNTVHVPEYAREYLSGLRRQYTYEDIAIISRKQLALENKIARKARCFLFCDTDILVTKLWSEFKYGKCDPWIEKKVKKHRYDLYLLCNIDLPWQEDPLREHPDKREELFKLYHNELEKMNVNYHIISGHGEERLRNAISAIESTFNHRTIKP